MRKRHTTNVFKRLFHGMWVALGAVALTLAFFLVLPLIQIINKPPDTDSIIRSVDTALPPPPPPPEEQPEEKPKPEEKPPELKEEQPQPEETKPLGLSQLELALNAGGDGAGSIGDFASKLASPTSGSKDVEALFSTADLDQRPRPVYQPSPMLTSQTRKKAPGTVHIIFVVDTHGRVENPIVQKSSDPVFEKPALAAIKQWKFEPGKRNGEPVRFRMRVPITFPKG